MKILQEFKSFDQANCSVELKESRDDSGKKDLYMKGIFIQGGVKNQNGRVYPVSEIRSAVDQINYELNSGKSVLGECDHPEELNINLDRVSHMITEMYMDGNNGIGKLKVLPTPMGNTIRALLENGVKLGVSSRGSGEVDELGEVRNFQIVTVDVVATPSAPDALPATLYEAFRGRRGRVIGDLSEAVAHDPKAQKFFEKELLNWVKNL